MLHKAIVGEIVFKVWLGAFCPIKIEKAGESFEDNILVCPFLAMSEVDLSEEVDGRDNKIKRLADVSKKLNCSIFCGLRTKALDVKHISVAVCNKGRLVDIADRASNPFNDELGTSNKIKVFSSKKGKIGLLIDTDCLIENNWLKTAPHSDVMLCINRGSSEFSKEEVRQYATAFGMPYLYVDEEGLEWG
ncbi:MAG: hypothetical protein FWE13_06410 [Firmicutes bacterium]|nr:hypothetical protein [Bacillota bacterium]